MIVCRAFILAAAPLLALTGCLGPDYEHVSNDLRTKNLALQNDLSKTQTQLKNASATITQLQASTPRIPILPLERLQQLFLIDHVEIRGMTTTTDTHHDGKIDGLRVMFRPLMEDGNVLPATGTAVIEAFDLSIEQGENRLGSWTFTPDDLKTKWYGGLGLSNFAVDCPWARPPSGGEVTITLTFTDALTASTFTDQKKITIRKP